MTCAGRERGGRSLPVVVDGRKILGLKAYKVRGKYSFLFAWIGEGPQERPSVVRCIDPDDCVETEVSMGYIHGSCYPIPFGSVPESKRQALREYARDSKPPPVAATPTRWRT